MDSFTISLTLEKAIIEHNLANITQKNLQITWSYDVTFEVDDIVDGYKLADLHRGVAVKVANAKGYNVVHSSVCMDKYYELKKHELEETLNAQLEKYF